jgi:hypothetical protein
MRARHLIVVLTLAGCATPGGSPDGAWFNPPGGDWVPDPATIAAMKADLESNNEVLNRNADPQKRPAKYWFQYQGKGSGPTRTIEFYGELYPISPDAERLFFDAFIPEICVIYASYLPEQRKFSNLALGGIKCPARI